MSSKNVKIFIEICSNCKQHSWCTRHKQQVYLLLAKDIQTHVTQAHSEVQVLIIPVGGTKMGSFQISCQGIVLFSKLSLGYFPHSVAVAQRINKFIEDFKNGKDLSLYQNNSQSPIKRNPNYNKSPSPKQSPLRKTNTGGFKINQSMKKQQEIKEQKRKQQNVNQIKSSPKRKEQSKELIKQSVKVQQIKQIPHQQKAEKISQTTKIQRGQVILPTKKQQKQQKSSTSKNIQSQKLVQPKIQQLKQHKIKSQKQQKIIQNKPESVSEQKIQSKKQTQQKVNIQQSQKKQQHIQKIQNTGIHPKQNKIVQQKNQSVKQIKKQTVQHISLEKQIKEQQKKQTEKVVEQNYQQQFENVQQSLPKIQQHHKTIVQSEHLLKQIQKNEFIIENQPQNNQQRAQRENQIIYPSEKKQTPVQQIKKNQIEEKDQFLQSCRETFIYYDKDKSGYLDKSQMNKFFDDLLGGMRISTEKSEQFKAKFIIQADSNKDSKIEFNQLVAIAKKIINT